MLRNFGPPEIIIIAILLIVIFGWKRLPDAARSLGRSARVFKSEVDEMKNDGKKPGETVPGETVRREADPDSARPSSSASSTASTSPTSSTSPIEENAPRTDNQSGPVA